MWLTVTVDEYSRLADLSTDEENAELVALFSVARTTRKNYR